MTWDTSFTCASSDNYSCFPCWLNPEACKDTPLIKHDCTEPKRGFKWANQSIWFVWKPHFQPYRCRMWINPKSSFHPWQTALFKRKLWAFMSWSFFFYDSKEGIVCLQDMLHDDRFSVNKVGECSDCRNATVTPGGLSGSWRYWPQRCRKTETSPSVEHLFQ